MIDILELPPLIVPEMDFGDVTIKGMTTRDFPEPESKNDSNQKMVNIKDYENQIGDESETRLARTVLPDHMSEELRRTRLFFQQEGRRFMESFLNRMSTHGQTGNKATLRSCISWPCLC